MKPPLVFESLQEDGLARRGRLHFYRFYGRNSSPLCQSARQVR